MRSGQKPDRLQSTEKEAGARGSGSRRAQTGLSLEYRGWGWWVGVGRVQTGSSRGIVGGGELEFFLRAVGGRQRIK